MWGCRPELRPKCSLQQSLRRTCFIVICCLTHLNTCLIEFINVQILLGSSSSGDTVTSVFMDSPALKFELNYLCSMEQQWGGRLQTVPGRDSVFTGEEVIVGISHHVEVRTVTTTFHWHFKSSLCFLPAFTVPLHWFYCRKMYFS